MRTLDFGDFRLTADQGFGVHTVVLRGPETSVVAVKGRGANFRPTLVIARTERALADKTELDAFTAASVQQLEAMQGFQEVSRKSLELASGSPAVLQRHRFVDPNGLKVEQLQLFVLQKGPALVLTVTDLAGEPFAEKELGFRAMLMSVVETPG